MTGRNLSAIFNFTHINARCSVQTDCIQQSKLDCETLRSTNHKLVSVNS